MTEPSDFGRFLKERRMAAHLTQDELAAAINKSGQYISNIEKGKNNAPPNPSDIEATGNFANSDIFTVAADAVIVLAF